MSTSTETYDQALTNFVQGIRQVEDDIACVLLYGSMARGDMRVGESDIDLCIFIRKEVFEVRERFLRVIETIIEASNKLMESGLPFQRCHYYNENELQALDAKFCSIWGGDKTSKVVFGEDIRPRIASTEAGRFIAGTVFYEARRILLPLSAYLHKESLTEEERQAIFNDLLVIRKAMPQSACNALGIWPDTSNAFEELARRLPHVELDAFKSIESLRGRSVHQVDAELLRRILRDALMLVQTLNEEIMAATNCAESCQPASRVNETAAGAQTMKQSLLS
jgi:predicted nucleotidyltransferase